MKKPKRNSSLRATAPAEREGFREGQEARKAGRPCRSPYLRPDGEPIGLFLSVHDAWLKGWRAQDPALRGGR